MKQLVVCAAKKVKDHCSRAHITETSGCEHRSDGHLRSGAEGSDRSQQSDGAGAASTWHSAQSPLPHRVITLQPWVPNTANQTNRCNESSRIHLLQLHEAARRTRSKRLYLQALGLSQAVQELAVEKPKAKPRVPRPPRTPTLFAEVRRSSAFAGRPHLTSRMSHSSLPQAIHAPYRLCCLPHATLSTHMQT